MKKAIRKEITCGASVGISASIEPPEVEMESENGIKGTIEVNERYELKYAASRRVRSKQYGRKISIQLLKSTKNSKEPILRMDNSHSVNDGSGKWPVHIHIPSGGRHMFVGASLKDVIEEFIKYASGLLSKKDLEDLRSSIEKLPFGLT